MGDDDNDNNNGVMGDYVNNDCGGVMGNNDNVNNNGMTGYNDDDNGDGAVVTTILMATVQGATPSTTSMVTARRDMTTTMATA